MTDPAPDHEPIRLTSALPGDAHGSSPPSPPPPPPPPASPFRELESTSAAAPPAEPGTYPLTSTSPTDPSKSRTFHARYFLPSSSSSAHASSSRSFLDLPESYFNPTAVELQQAFAGQVKRREELTDRPLLTQKLRDRQEAEKSRAKAARWPQVRSVSLALEVKADLNGDGQTRIRIRFADRSQLEGVFPSTDKLVHLYEFVRLSLSDEARSVHFLLYQSPPRTEYTKGDAKWKGKSLIELDFTPSSALYIKFEDDRLNGALCDSVPSSQFAVRLVRRPDVASLRRALNP
ncbi:SPOSA6832_04590, partial [Sporobolomyces salmonicolor]